MSFTPFNWECPHCGRPQTATESQQCVREIKFSLSENVHGHLGALLVAIACANAACKNVTLTIVVNEVDFDNGNWTPKKDVPHVLFRRLIPESSAKPQPDYIPDALREDYLEACRIRDLSPKASATLIRRCLQGMIRHFCGISKGRLVDEIAELRDKVAANSAPPGVSPESVDAIDHVRQIGNIGAHMEKDINHIVDVDPGEAQTLIELVEMLFDDWYVERHKRNERFAALKAAADAKEQARKAPSTTPPPSN